MKVWNKPEIAELGIEMTAGGLINVGWEGPFNIICGDHKHCDSPEKPDDKRDDVPSTPDTDQYSGI